MDEGLQILQQAQAHFLSSQSMKKFPLLDTSIDLLAESEDAQMKFIQMTFDLEAVQKFPVKISFQKSFLKILMDKIEERGCDISDRFYDLYCSLLEKEKEPTYQNVQYHHFPLPMCCNSSIIIRGDENFLSGGTTGLSLWQAGFALAEWCIENQERLKGKTILELGSGCGLTGLAVAVGCEAKHVIMTDGHEKVLEQLVENVKINSLEEKLSSSQIENEPLLSTQFGETRVSVINLPWENSRDVEVEDSPSLILAADVVYDPSVFNDLSKTLLHFLAQKEDAEAILACTLRNEDTLNGLFTVLGNRVTVEKEKPASKKYFIYDDQFPVLLFRLSKNQER